MFGAFNIGVSGLRAAQIGMDVTSHNVANVHTDGYKRQIVDLAEVSRTTSSPSDFGGLGVTVARIHNAEDPFIDSLLNKYAADNGKNAEALDGLQKLNDILNNNSLVNASTDILNAFQDVANNPTSIPIRENLLSKLGDFKNVSTNLNYQLNDFNKYLSDKQVSTLDETNNLLQNIANLNNQYNNIGASTSLDTQKNSLLGKLSEKIGFNIINNGNTLVADNGKILVEGNKATTLTLNDVNNLQSGTLGGINTVKSILTPIQNQLPSAVQIFTDQINTIHKQGYDLNGSIGQDVFSSFTSLDSLNISLSSPVEIAASQTSKPGINDGTNSQNISDLRYKFFNNQNVFDKLNELNRKVGGLVNQYDNSYKSTNSLYDNLHNSNLSNVNLDEEAVNLMKYQKMYEANAKVIQTANEMLGTLLSIKA
jgi:flagellar hook-associated protein 1 FlgK